MNCLSLDRKIQVLSCLVEGNSIRSTERMTGIHRDTIMRLLVRTGQQCRRVMDERLVGFHSRSVQVDEVWTFVQKKEGRLDEDEQTNSEIGDQYVFVAIDADSKLVPTYRVGKRNGFTALRFVRDLKRTLNGNGRIQLSSDGFKAYIQAVETTFGADVDYAQIIKIYASEHPGPGRYSPPSVSGVIPTSIQGTPDPHLVSTSFVERQNLTMRMAIRRFTRLTNAFSKKLDNLKASLALHFAHYNFVRIHGTLRTTPAMAAGITDHIWTWEELLTI